MLVEHALGYARSQAVATTLKCAQGMLSERAANILGIMHRLVPCAVDKLSTDSGAVVLSFDCAEPGPSLGHEPTPKAGLTAAPWRAAVP